MISILERIKTGDLPIKTAFGNNDYFVMYVAGQVCIIKKTDMGIPYLVNGTIPIQYTPWLNYEIIEVANEAALPVTGDSNYRYVTLDTLHSYFWTSAGYIDVTEGLTLGETSTTAYRGDRGKVSYDFSQGTSFTNVSELDSIGYGWSYPTSTTPKINSISILFVFTFGRTNYAKQLAYCDGGILYYREKINSATYGAWNLEQISVMKYTGGNKAIECDADTVRIYNIDGIMMVDIQQTDTYLYTKLEKLALQIEEDGIMIGENLSKCEIYSTLLQVRDSVDLTKTTELKPKSNHPTASSQSLFLPYRPNETLATEEYVQDFFTQNNFTYIGVDGLALFESELPDGTFDSETGIWTATNNGVLEIGSEDDETKNNIIIHNITDYELTGLWNVISHGSVSTKASLTFIGKINYVIDISKTSPFDLNTVYALCSGDTISYQCLNPNEIYPLLAGYFIGTFTRLNGSPDLSTANGVLFNQNGFKRNYGDARYWVDIDFSIIIRTTGTGVPTIATLIGNLTAPRWAVNDYHNFEGQEFIHPWCEGTAVYWHFHMYTNGLEASAKYVKFEIEYSWANINGALPATVTNSIEYEIPANTPDRTMKLVSISSFVPTGGKIGGHVKPRLKRVASSGAAPAADPFIEMLQLHVLCDSEGSSSISAK